MWFCSVNVKNVLINLHANYTCSCMFSHDQFGWGIIIEWKGHRNNCIVTVFPFVSFPTFPTHFFIIWFRFVYFYQFYFLCSCTSIYCSYPLQGTKCSITFLWWRPQSRQSARHNLQSSELGPPPTLSHAGECVPSIFVRGGLTHLWERGCLGGQFGRGGTDTLVL